MAHSRRNVLKTMAATGLIGATGLASRPARAQSGTFNYKVATNVQNTHPIYLRLVEATDRIKAETDGKVVIRVFPNGQLGSDTDMLSQVRSGGIELLTCPGVVLSNLVPMASLSQIGFAFPNYPSVWKAMDGSLGKYIRTAIAQTNLTVFDKIWDNGFRQVTASKVVTTPADLVDLKIRVPVSPLLISLFKTLRASPTPINYNELYSALQTHVVDAQENPLPIIMAAKLYEVQKYCSLTSHIWDGYWLIANKRAFEALPPSLRDIVSKNLDRSALDQRADSERLAVSLQQDLAAKGLIFNKPATEPFRAALQQGNFYADWKAKFGDEAWSQLESAVGKLA